MAAQTREALDELTCARPECDHSDHGPLYFHSRCHPQAATWAVYKDGKLRVECSVCDAEIVTVQVAEAHARGDRRP